mmetsp:Transcript_50461/g.156106  ORF Transcript_50461/g.156106 Transcript_50461/m.156106 type:complete len:289 (-) Transcript_50461:225-1091(-)
MELGEGRHLVGPVLAAGEGGPRLVQEDHPVQDLAAQRQVVGVLRGQGPASALGPGTDDGREHDGLLGGAVHLVRPQRLAGDLPQEGRHLLVEQPGLLLDHLRRRDGAEPLPVDVPGHHGVGVVRRQELPPVLLAPRLGVHEVCLQLPGALAEVLGERLQLYELPLLRPLCCLGGVALPRGDAERAGEAVPLLPVAERLARLWLLLHVVLRRLVVGVVRLDFRRAKLPAPLDAVHVSLEDVDLLGGGGLGTHEVPEVCEGRPLDPGRVQGQLCRVLATAGEGHLLVGAP